MSTKRDLTPIQEVDGIFLKRDDLFEFAGIRGGKVRSCLALATLAREQGFAGLVTAGSRSSPQVKIVARVGRELGLRTQCHVPEGPKTSELIDAEENGAVLVAERPGYNSVIIARAKKASEDLKWFLIPFGMECFEAVRQTSYQVSNIGHPKRIVVPIGSGMSAAGILRGLITYNLRHIPVVGVVVGANPNARLNAFAPLFWPKRMTLIRSEHQYSDSIDGKIGDVVLDPIYEAKVLPYIDKGDLFWIVGHR